MDLMHKLLLILGQMPQFSTVSVADVFATSTQPYSMILEVSLLFITEMASVEIVLSPPLLVFPCASEISQPEARFRPINIIF